MAKKLYPVNRLDISHMEHWLEDMADDGFFLTSLGSIFVTFASDVPQKVKYRFIPLDAADKRMEPTSEECELFLAHGWEFIDHLDERFLVFQNKADYPKEIPLEDGIQQERFHSLAKRFQKEYILGMLLTLIAFGIFVFLFFHNFHAFILFEDAVLDHFSILLFLLTLPFGRGVTRKTLRNLKSYGEDIETLAFDREEDVITTSPHFLISVMHAFSGILIPILGVAVIWGIFASSDDEWISMKHADDSVPQISLEELTGGSMEQEYGSYKKEYTIFAPIQYNIEQSGTRWVSVLEENTLKTSLNDMSLCWHYYELTSSELAEVTFDTWIGSDDGTHFGFGVDTEEKTSIDTNLMKKAYIHSVNDGWTSFWFLLDNVIVAGEYWGGEKEVITENLDLFAEVMQEKSPGMK